MSNPGAGIHGDESPDEMIFLEPDRADVHKETMEYKDKSGGMFLDWKLPKIPTNKIYKRNKTSCFPWQAKAKTIIDVVEAITKIEVKKDNRVDIQLFDDRKLRSLLRQNYKYVHLGLVQVGIVPLFGKELDVPAICAVCDTRFLKFRDGLLGGMHTILFTGPTWCKITPNYTVSLTGPSVKNILTIRVQTKGLTDLMRGCQNVAITYRVMYRALKSFHPMALDTPMSTEVFEPVPGRVLKFSGRQVEPRELQWPRSWVMDTPPSGSSSQASVTDMLVFEEDGKVTHQIPSIVRSETTRSVSSEPPSTSTASVEDIDNIAESLASRMMVGDKSLSLPIYEEEPESSKTILENRTTVANWKSKID